MLHLTQFWVLLLVENAILNFIELDDAITSGENPTRRTQRLSAGAEREGDDSFQAILKIFMMPFLIFLYLFNMKELGHTSIAGSEELGMDPSELKESTKEDQQQQAAAVISLTITDEVNHVRSDQESLPVEQEFQVKLLPAAEQVNEVHPLKRGDDDDEPADEDDNNVVIVHLVPQLWSQRECFVMNDFLGNDKNDIALRPIK